MKFIMTNALQKGSPHSFESYRKMTFGVSFPLFRGNSGSVFPHFRGSDRGGKFCSFSHLLGDFRPEASGTLEGEKQLAMIVVWKKVILTKVLVDINLDHSRCWNRPSPM